MSSFVKGSHKYCAQREKYKAADRYRRIYRPPVHAYVYSNTLNILPTLKLL